MKQATTSTLIGASLAIGLTGQTRAAEIHVSANIAVSTTWTANNVYNMQQQIYVLPGATLTIEPGTVVASTTNLGGSLAVCRGAQIFVNGTEDQPVIMTSKADVATWDALPSHPTGKNPQTGDWRVAANEWGNLTIMGEAFISDSQVPGNSTTCNVNNRGVMEGLVAAFPGDTNVLYGGNQDNDDSGSISYLSLRYGGKVIALANELNGLSLGGVGRNTDIHHIEIMNNVDDGIEVWGGTVNLEHVSIWNVGDDSLDIDQGWRGKAQFGLIVQGYSANAAQGSGVGDNAFETDGAEDSDAQPVTTATIYNFTVVGQPVSGDHGTAWRDNARVQYRNCIFMDLGERLVGFDNLDGDGAQGYGFNGTLTWPQTWNTAFTEFSDVNGCTNPAQRYQAQSAGNAGIGQGFLAEITDSVFFRNLGPAAYTESNNRNVTIAGGSNPAKANVVAADMPIAGLTRGAAVAVGALTMVPVLTIDPRAANDASSSAAAAPSDGFFAQASHRGGFGPNDNWLCAWTAADAFGFSIAPPGGCNAVVCVGDTNGSGAVDVNDLLSVIVNWGASGGSGDVNGDSTVNVNDLLLVITSWGTCP